MIHTIYKQVSSNPHTTYHASFRITHNNNNKAKDTRVIMVSVSFHSAIKMGLWPSHLSGVLKYGCIKRYCCVLFKPKHTQLLKRNTKIKAMQKFALFFLRGLEKRSKLPLQVLLHHCQINHYGERKISVLLRTVVDAGTGYCIVWCFILCYPCPQGTLSFISPVMSL